MPFRWARRRWREVPDAVGMRVSSAIRPRSAPRHVIDDESVTAPVEAGQAPSPRTKRETNIDAKAEADREAHGEAGPGSYKHDGGTVIRHHDERRVRRHDRNVRSHPHDNRWICSQIAILRGFPAQSLYRVHHIGALRQDGITQLLRPGHVGSHHVENRREWQKRLHAGVPGYLV